MKEKLKKIGIGLLAVFCVLYIVPSVLQVVPQLAGAGHSYIVVSGSMRPTLKRGDTVLVKEVNASDPSNIQKGDIVAMRAGSRVVTHRVIKKKGTSLYLTKGDANKNPDGWVKPEKIIGVVIFSIPTSVIYSVPGFIILYLIPDAILLAKGGYSFYIVLTTGIEKTSKKGSSKEVSEKSEREETKREGQIRKALEKNWGKKLNIVVKEKDTKFKITSKVKPEYREQILQPKAITEVIHRGVDFPEVIKKAKKFVRWDIKDAKEIVLTWPVICLITILFVSVVRLFLPVFIA